MASPFLLPSELVDLQLTANTALPEACTRQRAGIADLVTTCAVLPQSGSVTLGQTSLQIGAMPQWQVRLPAGTDVQRGDVLLALDQLHYVTGLWSPRTYTVFINADTVTPLLYILSFRHTVLWLPRITKDTIGATPSAGRDQIRSQSTTFSDGTYGVGWQAPQGGMVRSGFLAPIAITAAVLDNAQREMWLPEGISLYNNSLLLFDPRTVPGGFALGDLVVLQNDGRRFVVAPNSPGGTNSMLTPYQSFANQITGEVALDPVQAGNVLLNAPTV